MRAGLVALAILVACGEEDPRGYVPGRPTPGDSAYIAAWQADYYRNCRERHRGLDADCYCRESGEPPEGC